MSPVVLAQTRALRPAPRRLRSPERLLDGGLRAQVATSFLSPRVCPLFLLATGLAHFRHYRCDADTLESARTPRGNGSSWEDHPQPVPGAPRLPARRSDHARAHLGVPVLRSDNLLERLRIQEGACCGYSFIIKAVDQGWPKGETVRASEGGGTVTSPPTGRPAHASAFGVFPGPSAHGHDQCAHWPCD